VRLPTRRVIPSLALAAALALGAGRADAARAVDARRTRITEDAVYAPIGPGGAEVKLTLDPHLQRAAERLLAHSGAHEGAIVASDVRTGRILAWASRGDRDYVAEAFAPSASLFKIATAAALLEGGRVTPATRECYEGGEHEIRPADLDHHGAACASLADAMGHSINLVVARLAKKHLSPADLRREAELLGFSGEVPIDVPVSASVVRIPDDPFGMARASAGFWNGQLTPLGGLYAIQTIANDGERLRFSLIDHGGPTARVSAGRAVSVATARSLGRMLEITTRRGTARKAFHRPDGTPYLNLAVSAKTGTLIGGARPRMYSWFAGYAPSTKPEIALNVMLGNDLRWHTKANVIGRELLEAYFKPAHGAVAAAATKGNKRR
jgi:cell division protein FtsI/penicillin-binding protein 2